MSRRAQSAEAKVTEKFWITANADDRIGKAGYLQLAVNVLQSPQFQELTSTTKFVYLCMCATAKKSAEFIFPKETAARYGITESALRRASEQLEDAGFIKIESGWNMRRPNKYKFSRAWKLNGKQS